MKKKFLVGLAVGVMMLGGMGMAEATTIVSEVLFTTFEYGYYPPDPYDVLGKKYLVTFSYDETYFTAIDGSYSTTDYANSNMGLHASILSSTIPGAMSRNPDYFRTNGIAIENGKIALYDAFDIDSEDLFTAQIDNSGNGRFSFVFGNAGGDPRGGARYSGTISSPTPEPATMLLMGTGLAGLIGASRKKKA